MGDTPRNQMKRALEDWDPERTQEEARLRAEEIFAGFEDKYNELYDRADEFQSFTDWQAEDPSRQGPDLNAPLEGIQALIDQWQNGPSEDQYDAAYQDAARSVGLGDDEFATMLGELSRQFASGFDGQEGLSAEELAARGALDRATIRDMESRSLRLVQDSLADSGSTARMLQTAAEYSNQINNVQLQQANQLNLDVAARKLAQFNSSKEGWMAMVQANQMGRDAYLDRLQEGASFAMEAYAQQVLAMEAQHRDLLAEHAADQAAIQSSIDAIYNAITIELGVTIAELEAEFSIYKAEIQPYLDEVNMILANQEATFGWDDVWDGMLSLLGAIFSVAGDRKFSAADTAATPPAPLDYPADAGLDLTTGNDGFNW